MKELSEEQKQQIDLAVEEAFMAGRWRGQVDMEEEMDNNLFDAILMSAHARKSGGQCIHTVSNGGDINSRPVRYNLRSDKWREGVKKTTKEYLEKAKDNIYNVFNCCQN